MALSFRTCLPEAGKTRNPGIFNISRFWMPACAGMTEKTPRSLDYFSSWASLGGP